jgi:hypothetical protein
MENYSVLLQTTRANLGRIRSLGSIKTKSKDTEIAPLRSTGKFAETEGRRNPVGKSLDGIEAEATAEAHGVVTHIMNRLSPISEPYSGASVEEEKRVQIERPMLGTRSIRRL